MCVEHCVTCERNILQPVDNKGVQSKHCIFLFLYEIKGKQNYFFVSHPSMKHLPLHFVYILIYT